MDSILKIVCQVGCYGILVDDMTDISVVEQMISFIQLFNPIKGSVETAFLFIKNVLSESDSADAKTLCACLCNKLEELNLDVKKMKGMVSDGASMMLGKKNGLAAKLKAINSHIVFVHCVCHRLALACTDTIVSLKYIQEVELIVTQLWKMFENSPKKMAQFLKTQEELHAIKLSSVESRSTIKKN
uniref:Zinc finger protein 862-like n=1 Tax=Saccoglossus kowalevskii TaxID=10224 RepID=A0ABM0LVV2_SACKO|nr:PREDICTED: zinc finger protein 862-like [Saccoglossus kowalevskii]